MKNANLKKRAMAALISSTLIAGGVAGIAPSAEALTYMGSQAQIVNAYERLSEEDLRQYFAAEKPTSYSNGTFVLPTDRGPGWCIDWGIDNPWNNEPGGYEVRKLTGASGRVGDGLGINQDILLAAINVTKSLTADFQTYQKQPSPNLLYRIQQENRILQALLSNNLGALNEIRSGFHYNQLNSTMFETMTGFSIRWKKQDVAGDGTPNYVLTKNDYFKTVEENYNEGEYITVLVPKSYNLNLNPKLNPTFQRIVTVVQPGLPGFEPKPGQETITETTKVQQPPVTTTVTSTRPASKTTEYVQETPRTVTETYTHPVVTVTERSTLPKAHETVRVTRPVQTVTETEKVTPVTKTVTETVSGTPVEKTVVETPPAKVVTTTREGEPTTVTETVSDTPVVVTKPASTVTATRWATPTRTTVKDVPGGVVTETKTITPEPATSTRVIPVTENYYTEKVYESVKEVHEYYYFAGFTKDDKSKTIVLPDGVKGSWTFEVIKGRDIVVVERTEDGKLTITPRPDFEGEGDVEILITDELGNQYIYRVKVSDTITVQTQTNVKVNNFFYTINPDSENRIKVIEKNPGEKTDKLVWIDADGNEHDVLPGDIDVIDDEQQVKVEVKDPNLRGQIVVKIVEESGNVRENIVTIENTTSKFDVVREILSTSTAIVERRGGDYTFKSGEDLVEITEGENDNWIIKPKDKDTEGTVEIVFTDENGVEYNYTIKIKNDVNSGPVIRNYEIQSGSDAQDGDTVKIERRDDWDIKVISGDVDVEATTGKLDENGDDTNIWTVKPRDGFTGEAVIHVVDKKTGSLVGVWNIQVNPGRNTDELEVKSVERDIVDRSIVDLYLGFKDAKNDGANPNRFTFDTEGEFDSYDEMIAHYKTEYEGIIDFEKSTLGEGGDWQLVFKPGAEGTVKIAEQQVFFDKDDNAGYQTITEYTYNVSPAPVRELNYDVTSDNILNLSGTNLRVVNAEEAKKLLAGDVPADKSKRVDLEFNRDANGQLILENVTDEGFVFERYTINVTPGRDANFKPLEREMGWNATAHIPGAADDEAEVTEGEDLVNVTRDEDTDQFVIKPVPGKTGLAVIKVKDGRGAWAEYRLNIVEPKKGEKTYTIATNSQFRASVFDGKNSFLLVSGSEYFQPPRTEDGEWILQPKADAAGNSGVVEERDQNGDVINRYTVNIIQGKVLTTRSQRSVIPENGWTDIPAMNNGGKFVVVAGNEYVTTSTVNGEFRVTANSDTVGKVVRVEERNDNGDVLRTITLDIVPADAAESGPLTAEGAGFNKDLPEINVDNSVNTGEIKIDFPEGSDLKDFVLTKNSDLVDQIIKTGPGNYTLKLKDGAKGEVHYVVVDENGNQSLERHINIKVNERVVNETTQKGSSAELDGKCIAGIVGLTAPLLLAIPLGILSQVQIPGLEGVSAQINGAIQQANDQIQRGLGIYDEDRAQRAAGIQGAFSIENPQMLGMAAGALGAISLGLLAVDGVMRACGAEEYTSSYMIGKATGSETLMNGSSGKADKKDNNSADEAKGSSKAEDSADKEK
ncbi:hypothetical protein [Corynebacterium afermentans]